MQVSFSAFSRKKINTLTPAFMPVNFGKVPNPFDFQCLATEDAGKTGTKLRKSSRIARYL
jgi:hypothetical protein